MSNFSKIQPQDIRQLIEADMLENAPAGVPVLSSVFLGSLFLAAAGGCRNRQMVSEQLEINAALY